MNENNTKNAIIDYLLYRGALVLRVNSGAFKGEYTDQKGHKRKRFGYFCKWWVSGQGEQIAGVSDILALWQGRLYAIETKAVGKKNNVSEAQQRFLSEVVSHGGVGIVADSIDDVAVAMR
jgi:hypothetical protein